jgi:hypothetical protein
MGGNLRRLLESVGLQRRKRDVTMTLQQYLAARAARPSRGMSEASAGARVRHHSPMAHVSRQQCRCRHGSGSISARFATMSRKIIHAPVSAGLSARRR